ncbi:FeS assembly ATPase SufC [Candidatus Hodgkinia cicadicola]|nr:FeS assembly ATPase SufC [Candidatus Hodgkinia cicadicola]
MLSLNGVSVYYKCRRVLTNLVLKLVPGELCVLVGKNGVGKTSFANALIADKRYNVDGSVILEDSNVRLADSLRLAKLGIFLAFQHPAEIPGVVFIHFVKLAVSKLNSRLVPSLPAKLSMLTEFLSLSTGLLHRAVNVGFSGGERRMLELVQMVALEPKVCILDETDSGLDRVRLQSYVDLVLAFGESFRTMLIITHNMSVVKLLKPDSVYCLVCNGIINITKLMYDQ